MDIVEEIRAFVATAQTGSFTAAAEQLGVSNRLTSKYVASLEDRLGTRLLQRTTRQVGLTPAGEDLLSRAPKLLDEFDTMVADLADDANGYSGLIRISAPMTFGETYVAGMLTRFRARNPNLTFDLRLSDRYADLAADGIDVALRIGRSDNLTLKSRKLGTLRSLVAASPAYLAEHGTPKHPKDLHDHICIIDTNRKHPRSWEFQMGEQALMVPVQGNFRVNSASTAVALAKAGQGIVYAPRFAMSEALASGALIPVLQDHCGAGGPVSAVYLEGRTLPRKVRALIDFAVQDIRDNDAL